jgi:hypothetical protein
MSQRVHTDTFCLRFTLKQHCHTHGIPDAVIPSIAGDIPHCLHHAPKLADCIIRTVSTKYLEAEPVLIENATGLQPVKTAQQPGQCHHILPRFPLAPNRR